MKGQFAYDLEERTARFGEDALKLCTKLPKNDLTKPLISQFIRSATSYRGKLYGSEWRKL